MRLHETAQPCAPRAIVDQRDRFRAPAGLGLAAGRAGCFAGLIGRAAAAGACARFGCAAAVGCVAALRLVSGLRVPRSTGLGFAKASFVGFGCARWGLAGFLAAGRAVIERSSPVALLRSSLEELDRVTPTPKKNGECGER
jgi:hypothetical protein